MGIHYNKCNKKHQKENLMVENRVKKKTASQEAENVDEASRLTTDEKYMR